MCILIILCLLCLTLAGGLYMAHFACGRKKDVPDYWTAPDALPKPDRHIPEKDLPEVLAGRAFLLANGGDPIHIQSRDGIPLTAHYIPPAGEPRGIYLQVHGYRSHPLCDFAGCVREMHEMGYGLFLIDQRACGGSGGQYITFGLRERYDVVDWCHWLHAHFPTVPVVLDGISLGATTVLLAAGEELPDNVGGIIADCGYTAPAAICKKVLRQWFHLPPFPLYYAAVLWIRLCTGEWFTRPGKRDPHATGDVCHALARNTRPLLLAHGEADSFVPHWMGQAIYDSCKDKDVVFLSVPGAEHGMSWLLDTDTYRREVAMLWEKAETYVRDKHPVGDK